VPKTTSLERINDYIPISVTNIGVKFLSKMVADRLQQRIISCVHKNQYDFIKGRTIHDCLGWSFEYLHQCKMSKREIVVLKLDLEKAFDSIEHEALYMVLRKMGFPELFISWDKSLLETGTSVVLVNGVPGRNFRCKRGVRQGDPLSLFCLFWEQSYYSILLMISRINDC
jgi:mannosylglycoprotein endo-beta-mannosidase